MGDHKEGVTMIIFKGIKDQMDVLEIKEELMAEMTFATTIIMVVTMEMVRMEIVERCIIEEMLIITGEVVRIEEEENILMAMEQIKRGTLIEGILQQIGEEEIMAIMIDEIPDAILETILQIVEMILGAVGITEIDGVVQIVAGVVMIVMIVEAVEVKVMILEEATTVTMITVITVKIQEGVTIKSCNINKE